MKEMINRKILKESVVLLVMTVLVSAAAVTADTMDERSSGTMFSKVVTDCRMNMFDDNWIHFDDGDPANSIGLTNGGTYEAAIRITPNETGGHDGWSITVVKFYHFVLFGTNETHSGNIKIYEGGTSTEPGALITSEPYTVTGSAWFNIPLSNPVVLDDKDVWVSVEITHAAGDHPISVDAGPAVDGKGDWIEYGSGWNELQGMGIDCNWCIWAKVEDCSDVEIEISGGLGVSAVIKNTGEDITNLEWSIALEGDLILFGQDKTGVIEHLSAGDKVTIQSFVFGLCRPTITVIASCTEETASGLVLGPFVIGVE